MRVAFNALAATRGGGVTQLRPLLSALRNERPDWEMVVYLANDRVVAPIDGVDARRVRVLGIVQRAWLEWFGLERRARREGADFIVNLLNSGSLKPSLPSVTWQRNALYFDRGWLHDQSLGVQADALVRRTAALLTSRASAATLVPTEAMSRMVSDWWCGRHLRLQVVPHGVDAEEFTFSPSPLSKPLILGVMGHAASHRGLETAVQALHQLVSRGVDAQLLLTVERAGNPAFQSTVDTAAEVAKMLGVHEKVQFGGAVPDPASWYRGVDILLVPSSCESFGFPVIEALACGTTVVTSGIPSLREVGATAALHADRPNAAGLADAVMLALAESPRERDDRLRRSRELAHARTWTEAAKQLAAIIEALRN